VSRARQFVNRAVRRALGGTAYKSPHWIRRAETDALTSFAQTLDARSKTAVAVTGSVLGGQPWRTYTVLEYPAFDLLDPHHAHTYDVVLCEHVLEHVRDPWRAARTLRDLCRPGGTVIVVTPFLVKVHRDPIDLWRFTEEGLAEVLSSSGLDVVETGSWGNALAVSLNARIFVADRAWVRWLHRWTMARNPATPMSVWAFARWPDARDRDRSPCPA
jgi:SAM-dependent methyltransferase